MTDLCTLSMVIMMCITITPIKTVCLDNHVLQNKINP